MSNEEIHMFPDHLPTGFKTFTFLPIKKWNCTYTVYRQDLKLLHFYTLKEENEKLVHLAGKISLYIWREKFSYNNGGKNYTGGKKVQFFYLRCWKATSTERMVGVKSAR